MILFTIVDKVKHPDERVFIFTNVCNRDVPNANAQSHAQNFSQAAFSGNEILFGIKKPRQQETGFKIIL